MSEKIIVIGTNHAGTNAILTLLDNYSEKVEVTTYDKNDNISFLGCGMALWIGGVIDKSEGLFYANPKMLSDKGAKVYMETEMLDIDFAAKVVTLKDKKTEKVFTDNYDKLIIGIGSWPVLPPLPGHDLENIIYAKIFQNAENAIEKIKDPSIKKVCVVGGGYIGVELAEAFAVKGKEVTLINNFDVLNMYYDEEFQSEMAENLSSHGIKLALDETVTSFKGTGKVSAVVTDKGEHECDLVLMSIGIRPSTEMLKGKLDMAKNGAILVNDHQQTSVKDVYAIGDCCTVHSNATDADAYIALATNAVRTGIVAAHNIGGTPVTMNGVQGSNAIHIFGLTMCSTGLSELSAKNAGFDVGSVTVNELIKATFMPENDTVKLKVVWDKASRRILGAQISSRTDITLALHMFSLAIEQHYSIDKLALLDTFFLPHFNQPVNFITKAGLLALGK